MPSPRAILFDLDNTLFHWDPCDEKGREAAYAVFHHAFPVPFERFMEMYRAARKYFKALLHNQASSHNRVLFFKHILESLDPSPRPALALQMYQRYWQAFFHAIKPHPDAQRVLSQLKQTHRIVMVSNHPTHAQLDKVARLGFDPHFDAIVTSEETGVEKPDPRIFQVALDRVGVKAEEAVMIGDHTTGDIEGAHAAGIRTIYMSQFNRNESAPACADYVVERLGDVLAIVRGM
ncbi:MAG: HAD family hydrolase [Phycisphaeraceae bacterium]